MKILFIGTVNGKLDEGMRNVATHIGRELEKIYQVRYVFLKDFSGIISGLFWCNQILISARADKKLYLLAKMLEIFKPVNIILVQKPRDSFCLLFKKPLRSKFFSISRTDAMCLPGISDNQVVKIETGIDIKKFSPVSKEKQNLLKQQLGFSCRKKLALHVGHCSAGRQVEKICELDEQSFERVVIASGMFEDPEVREQLDKCHVKVISGYIPDVEKYYQAADVYLFPTICGDYVISVPLSIMEALACGTPVVAYDKISGISDISTIDSNVLLQISEQDDLQAAMLMQCGQKRTVCLLKAPKTWAEAAKTIADFVNA